jgi:hypothetical protein
LKKQGVAAYAHYCANEGGSRNKEPVAGFARIADLPRLDGPWRLLPRHG